MTMWPGNRVGPFLEPQSLAWSMCECVAGSVSEHLLGQVCRTSEVNSQ